MLQDLRLAFRALTRSPGFYILTAATLALGIGTATVLFTVTESVLWRPLPFPDSERLVEVVEQSIKRPGNGGVSAANFVDWRTKAQSFEGLAAYRWPENHILSGSGFSERVRSSLVSAGFFELLRVQPALGRAFQPQDEHSGSDRVAILTYDCWQRDFGSSADVLQQSVKLDGEVYHVVGVLPPGLELEFLVLPDLFVPLTLSGTPIRRDSWQLSAIARLRPEVTMAGASAEMKSLGQQLAVQYPKSNADRAVTIENLRTSFTKYYRRPLFLFLGFAGFVLAIACVNVASLLMVRFVGRQRECALRMALGAGRGALLRQALAENLCIAIPGGVGGLLLALWGVAGLDKWLPPDQLTRTNQIGMDWRIVLFVMAVALGSTAVFSLTPAVMSARLDMDAALRDWGRSIGGNRVTRRRIGLLIGAEIMLAFVLLFAAGLFLSSYVRLTRIPLGFDPKGLLTMRITPGAKQLSQPADRAIFYRSVQEKIGSVAGIREATLASSLPLVSTSGVNFVPRSQSVPPHSEPPYSLVRMISPEYFHLFAIPLLQGRAFTEHDSLSAPRVAIVNQNLARSVFGTESPIGKELVILPGNDTSIPEGTVQIVGLATNNREVGLNEVAFSDIYLPFAQNPGRSIWIAAKSDAPLDAVAAAVRQELKTLDPEGALYYLKTMENRVNDELRGSRFDLSLIAVFAGLAMLLACVGIYGAIGFSVAERTREFGLRMALGARPANIMRLTLAHTARLTLAGAVCGIAVALILGTFLREAMYLVPGKHPGMLYGVDIHDPVSLFVAACVVVGLAALAGLAPATRAAKTDPLTALQHE